MLRPDQRYAAEARDSLDSLFDLLAGPIRPRKACAREGGRELPLSVFRRAVVMDPAFTDIAGQDQLYVGADIFDLWPFQARTLTARNRGGEPLIVRRIESVTAKQTRGLIRRPMPRMIRSAAVHVDPAGTGWITQHVYGFNPADPVRRLVNLVNVPERDVYPVPADVQFMVRVAAGTGLWMEYAWTVEIASRGHDFPIIIPTAPAGARALLALRDVPAGRKRRAALRHWVSEHYRRRSRDEAEADVHVRQHLRGATPFEWDDYYGVVRPSPYDLRLNSGAPR